MIEPIIILASGSKRRSEILSSCGIKHIVMPSSAHEIMPKKNNLLNILAENAELKARTVHEIIKYKSSRAVIIGADTLVSSGRKVIGKPRNKKDAVRILKSFSGRKIEVITALFVIDTHKDLSAKGFEKSLIRVKSIAPREINKYFTKLGPYDKAGGFSIEGAGSLIFDDITGSYFNILGLPMEKLARLFSKIGYSLLDFCR